MEKASNVEVKANLQPTFSISEIDSRCLKHHRPSAKKNKEDIYRESRNEASKNKNKAKSQISSFANQLSTQAPHKDKRDCQGGHKGHLVTKVNTTEVANNNKASKDRSHAECYTCHQKSYYAKSV